MDESLSRARLPSKKALENYASAYIGAYMNVIEKERPEVVPPLAKSAPHEVEVCLMPNASFAMLFERADRQNVAVKECDWGYVEGKVMSGVSHMVTVYAHEGPTVADAIAKGKKDAVRDIRSMEDSALAKAVSGLEKILEDLTSVEKGNKSLLKVAEMQMSKLRPIKEALATAGPQVDMLAMVDALKNYPTSPVEVSIDIKERQLLESITRDLGNLSDVIKRIEMQDQKLEQLEQGMNKALSEFSRAVDERVGKGLAVVLSSSDRKIDKGLAELRNVARNIDGKPAPDLEERLSAIEKSLKALGDRPDVGKEVVLAVAEVRDTMHRVSARVTKIEQFLVQMTAKPKAPRK